MLGETWQERGEAPDWERLSDRREHFAAPVPDGGLSLTAGADVQGNRIEVDVWAWGRGLESWLVDHVVIEGGPSTQDAWRGLDDLLITTWTHQSGLEMKISRLCIDTGYEAPAVYAWARAAGFGQVSPVKGVEGFSRSSPVSGPTFVDATVRGRKLSRGARLWTVAVSTFKSETRHRRRRPVSDGTIGPSKGIAFVSLISQVIDNATYGVISPTGFLGLDGERSLSSGGRLRHYGPSAAPAASGTV